VLNTDPRVTFNTVLLAKHHAMKKGGVSCIHSKIRCHTEKALCHNPGGHLPWRACVNAIAVHAEFVAEKMALGQTFLIVLQFSLANHSCTLPYSCVIILVIKG
jgi:hypothetical protein